MEQIASTAAGSGGFLSVLAGKLSVEMAFAMLLVISLLLAVVYAICKLSVVVGNILKDTGKRIEQRTAQMAVVFSRQDEAEMTIGGLVKSQARFEEKLDRKLDAIYQRLNEAAREVAEIKGKCDARRCET